MSGKLGKYGASLVDSGACGVVAVLSGTPRRAVEVEAGDFVSPKLFHFDAHLFVEKDMEIVSGKYVPYTCQLALGKYVAVAEDLFVDIKTGGVPPLAYYVAPVVAVAVDGAAVVKDYTAYAG